MAKRSSIRLSNEKRHEVVNRTMEKLFGKRVKELDERLVKLADAAIARTDPRFIELISDVSLRPYLSYSTSTSVYVSVHRDFNSDKPLANPRSIVLRTVNFRYISSSSEYCKIEIGMSDGLCLSEYHGNSDQMRTTWRTAGAPTIALTDAEIDELTEIFRLQMVLRDDFNSVLETLKSAVIASKYVHQMCADFPIIDQFYTGPKYVEKAELPIADLATDLARVCAAAGVPPVTETDK